MSKTSRSTEKYVKYRCEENIQSLVESIKINNNYIIALEISEKSIPLTEFNLKTRQPVALVLGDENFGISEFVLNQADAIVHINMFGNNSSMNVVQAASIALYEITKQFNVADF